MIGETIGHYRILAELGSGGMGVVYEAEDLKLGRAVALKFVGGGLVSDPAVRDRFLREARAAAALNHPNICTIYEINDSEARPFIAMELLQGETLQQRLESGPLPLSALLDVAIQVADALEAAHARGLVHRDIKPGNIFVTADGRAKVVDFGLAKITSPVVKGNQSLIETAPADDVAVTRRGTTLGTVAYMSPEQARGEKLDARSDLFSFGLVLYEMATGRRAFDGATTAIVFDGILNRTPLPPSFINPTVPSQLEQVIGCAIEKDPPARYQRAADLAADLRRLRRASEPEVAVSQTFVPSAAGAGSTKWPATPPSGVGAQPAVASGSRGVWAAAGTRVSSGRFRRTILLTLVGVLVGAGAGLAWWLLHAHPMAAGAPVLVTDFVNRTGDADFDGTLKQALTIKLEESPYLRVVSQQKVREALALMARRPDDPVTPAVGREMCQRIGGGALVTGEIVKFGSTYLVTLGAESCSGDEIGREQAKARSKDEVLDALGTALSSMRGRLGESLASIRAHDKPMTDATTSSLPALKSLSLGDRKRAAGVDLEAIPYYKQALNDDPQFALAWARLGTTYANTGEDTLATQCYQRAYDLRNRASEHERFYITSHYYRMVARDFPKAREQYELWRQEYPHDFVPVHNLGIVYAETGEPELALQAFRDASAMEPRNRLARESVAQTLLALGHFDEARAIAEKEINELGDSPVPHLMLYGMDYVAGNGRGMAEHAKKVAGTPFDLERESFDYQTAFFEGRLHNAQALLERCLQDASARGRAGFANTVRASDILNRAVVGLTRDTRADVTRVLAGTPDEGNTLKLAFASILAGDVARARTMAAPFWVDLDRTPSKARITKPAFDALVAIKEGRPARAIDLLKDAEPWETKMKDGATSAYVRGLACLALGEGRCAEAAFQKLPQLRGLDPVNVVHVLCWLNIGRARALAGNPEGAREAYDRFFTLWKNADADIPVLEQAKAEYARLPRTQ